MRTGEEGGGRKRKEKEGEGRRRKENEETRGRRNEEEGVGRVRKRRDQIQRPSRASKGKLCFHVFFSTVPQISGLWKNDSKRHAPNPFNEDMGRKFRIFEDG